MATKKLVIDKNTEIPVSLGCEDVSIFKEEFYEIIDIPDTTKLEHPFLGANKWDKESKSFVKDEEAAINHDEFIAETQILTSKPLRKVVIKEGNILSVGYKDVKRYEDNPDEYEVKQIPEDMIIPDSELVFLKWDLEKDIPIVDQEKKEAILAEREREEKIRAEAKRRAEAEAEADLIDKGEINPLE